MKRTTVSVNKESTLTGHKDCIYTLAGLKDSQICYSGAGDGMVVAWDLADPENGQLIAKVPNSVYALALDERRNQLVLGHNYDGVHFIDLETRTERYSVKLTSAAIFDIQIFEDLCFVSTGDGELIAINISESPTIVKRMGMSDKSARALSVNPVDMELAVGFSDHLVRILDLKDLSVKHEISGHTNSVFTVRYSPDYQHLMTAGRDANFKVWDTMKYQQQESIVAHLYAINHIDFSPSGKHFVTCSMDKAIKVWDLQTFRLLKVIDKARHAGHGTSVNKLFWSGYKNQLVSASDDRTISVWNLDFEN
ncbi:MAG: WD40 repeat domain-containing protein [Cyclobacteriaceae bacterium]